MIPRDQDARDSRETGRSAGFHPSLTGDDEDGRPRFILTEQDGLEDAILTDRGRQFGQTGRIYVFPRLGRVRQQGAEVEFIDPALGVIISHVAMPPGEYLRVYSRRLVVKSSYSILPG